MLNRILQSPSIDPRFQQTRAALRLAVLALIAAILSILPTAVFAETDAAETTIQGDERAADDGSSTNAKSAGAKDQGRLGIELNKLEQVDEICRIYFVFENAINHELETLQLELVLFDTKGFIQRRLTLDAAPIAEDKTSVKLFDLPATQCTDVGRILINDVLAMSSPDGALPNDVSQLDLSSKLDVDLFK